MAETLVCSHCGSKNIYKEEGVFRNTYKCRNCGEDFKKEDTGLTAGIKIAGVGLTIMGLIDSIKPANPDDE